MSLKNYSIMWPKLQTLFPVHFQRDTMPTKAEVEAKVVELYSSGDNLEAARLSIWLESLAPEAFPKPSDNSMHPRPDDPPQSSAVAAAFDRLAKTSSFDDKLKEAAKTEIKFKDYALPVAVMGLAVTIMLSAVVFGGGSVSQPSVETRETQAAPFSRNAVAPEAQAPAQELSSKETAPREAAQFFSGINVYKVSNDLTLSPAPTKDVADLWSRTVAIFGEDAKKLRSLGIARENGNNIAGYLQLDSQELVINLNDTMKDKKNQSFTLVHEYNHMVTLVGQYEKGGSSCSTTLLLNGNACLAQDSSLQRWVQRFWPNPEERQNTSTGNIAAGEERYSENPEGFVSIYAASAPQEDMAESFAAWVLDYPMPKEKELFFESDKESRALKVRILSSLDELDY